MRKPWPSPLVTLSDSGDVFSRVSARAIAGLSPADRKALDAAFDEVRRAGRGSVSTLSALLEVLADVARQVTSEPRRRSLLRHIELVHATGVQALTDQADCATLEDAYRRARTAVLDESAERW